ncbi:MAG: hypothetical protein A3K19_17405 [Lentisphaerae bacterium RIFOXYB12_FULL_65_16]|nr:MAG: hypothetical protein A3K18_09035 [Lentisphaerae bacterium RIFOXYA12_64_32]OGV85642.1 MAG: hypothetical protein A3K19_17405 [Lentisphaerae bacterium RIFOXYB12_FULL_65_16]
MCLADAPGGQVYLLDILRLAGNVLTLEQKLPADGALPGKMLYLRAGTHRTAYRILEVLPPGNAVRLEHSGLLFRSKILNFSGDRMSLTTELPPPIETGKGFKPGYYDGALVTGEDLRAQYRVRKVDGDRVVLDRPAPDTDFPDSDGDGRRMVLVFEHGPGDDVVLPHSVFVRVVDGKAEQQGAGGLTGF